ncbi:MAG: hypothetical protein IH602_24025 [Bryobacteraceae bacterium]|nr:hypothetical protein [Bryobacteraceae bacterium]
MAETSTVQLVLSPREWAYIARLLRSEQDKLLHELNHTATRAFRETLHAQLEMAEKLIARMPDVEE